MSVYSAQSEDVLNAVGSTADGLILSYPKIHGNGASSFCNGSGAQGYVEDVEYLPCEFDIRADCVWGLREIEWVGLGVIPT
jgi:hypothetical protein